MLSGKSFIPAIKVYTQSSTSIISQRNRSTHAYYKTIAFGIHLAHDYQIQGILLLMFQEEEKLQVNFRPVQKIYLLFLLRSKCSRLINDAMAGGNVAISLSLSDSTLNSWH